MKTKKKICNEKEEPAYQQIMDVDRSESEIAKEKQMKKLEDESGLSLTTSIFFVVGDVVGAGVVALPYSMKLVGYLGVPIFLMCSLLMCYCAILLAKACAQVMSKIDRTDLRDPYPRVGLEATGKYGRYITIFALFINQVLTSIVFVLLAGEILLELVPTTPWDHLSYRMQLRIWFTVCCMFLLPFTFLGSPKDFAGIGFMAMATSFLAILLIITMLGYISKYPVDNEKKLHKTMDGFLHAFGTVLFGFGGVSIFPTIQADMKKPEQFVTSVTIGYMIISVVYIATPLAAYVILGDLIREDLLTTFSYLELYFTKHLFRTFSMASQACICGHVLCAFVLNINPVYQQFEALVNIPSCKFLVFFFFIIFNDNSLEAVGARNFLKYCYSTLLFFGQYITFYSYFKL